MKFRLLMDCSQPMLHYKAVARNRFRKMSDILLCIFGLVAMAYTTSLTIMSWASDSGSGLPSYCDRKGNGLPDL